jgi:lysophospholipase L1-like esterase
MAPANTRPVVALGDSITGGQGDKLHPNRTGYHAIGNAVDLRCLAPSSTRN